MPNALADPTLELRDSNGTLLISDNDWQDNAAQAAIITAAGLAPSNAKEAAIAATLPPGLYTALLAGLNNGTGIGLVEVYDLGNGGRRANSGRYTNADRRHQAHSDAHARRHTTIAVTTDTAGQSDSDATASVHRELRWSDRASPAPRLGGDKSGSR